MTISGFARYALTAAWLGNARRVRWITAADQRQRARRRKPGVAILAPCTASNSTNGRVPLFTRA